MFSTFCNDKQGVKANYSIIIIIMKFITPMQSCLLMGICYILFASTLRHKEKKELLSAPGVLQPFLTSNILLGFFSQTGRG